MRFSAQRIESLLRQADIEGLIEIGAPGDEYDSEAKLIHLALVELEDQEHGEDKIAAVVTEIWRKSFDLDALDLVARRHAIGCFVRQLLHNQKTS